MLSTNSLKISNFPSYLYFRQKWMICKQPMDQSRLLSQKNASNSNNTMENGKV